MSKSKSLNLPALKVTVSLFLVAISLNLPGLVKLALAASCSGEGGHCGI